MITEEKEEIEEYEEYEEAVDKKEEKKEENKKEKEKEKKDDKEEENSEENEEEESENEEEEKNDNDNNKSKDKDKEKVSNKINNTNISKDNNKKSERKKTNLKKDYTEKEIIENAGFKIEKSSKEKSIDESDEENKDEPIENKVIPDSPEIRKLRVQAAKIKNQFPNWSKVSGTKGGDLAVKCWNCENINICNSNFNVIQCPVCNEMNKVPKPMDRIDELLQIAKANTCITYADMNHTVPLVNYIVVCPYCKCDNKVRETAYYCICYMCKNKWTIKRPDADNVKEVKNRKPPKQKRFEGNYYKYDSKTGTLIPPDKPMRFSDLFYPDPMFYPGYYPINSLSPLYPEYFTPYDDYRYIDRQEKTMKYFDRVNQQKKMMEQFGDILEDNNKIIDNNNINIISNNASRIVTPLSKKYEKPYYHLNYDEDMNKRDILRQLEALDKKSENLMKNRIFPKALTEKSSENSIKAIKSRYNGFEESSYGNDDKSKASINVSSLHSDLKAPEMNRTNKSSALNNNLNSKMEESNSQFSKSKSKGNQSNLNKSSQNDVSSKIKSIESTYFLNK